MGLNNIKANDYMNVILHSLAHVGPMRDFFLRPENYAHVKRPPGDQTFNLGMTPTHVQCKCVYIIMYWLTWFKSSCMNSLCKAICIVICAVFVGIMFYLFVCAHLGSSTDCSALQFEGWVSCFVKSGILETSSLMSVLTRCCRQWLY